MKMDLDNIKAKNITEAEREMLFVKLGQRYPEQTRAEHFDDALFTRALPLSMQDPKHHTEQLSLQLNYSPRIQQEIATIATRGINSNPIIEEIRNEQTIVRLRVKAMTLDRAQQDKQMVILTGLDMVKVHDTTTLERFMTINKGTNFEKIRKPNAKANFKDFRRVGGKDKRSVHQVTLLKGIDRNQFIKCFGRLDPKNVLDTNSVIRPGTWISCAPHVSIIA